MFLALTIEDHNGNAYELITSGSTERLTGECHGLHGLPPPRRVIRTLPGAHGEINETRNYASRQPVWNGTIFRAGGGAAGALWTQYDGLLSALWGAVSEPRLMKWTRSDGKMLQTLVKLGDAFDPVISAKDNGALLAYQLIFDREDPRNYSQTLTTSTGNTLSDVGGGFGFNFGFPFSFTPGGSGLVAVGNSGTIDTPGVFTIRGAVSNPQIRQGSTGLVIALSGSLGTGSTLTIDAAARTVLLDGTADRGNLIDFASTDWDAGLIPPGGDVYQLLATSWDASARLDVSSRDAYA
jgi:Siphovirus-type tail component, C-terminal domain